jgi:hypothetical protein
VTKEDLERPKDTKIDKVWIAYTLSVVVVIVVAYPLVSLLFYCTFARKAVGTIFLFYNLVAADPSG